LSQEVQKPEEPKGGRAKHQDRTWWKRRNRLDVRNGHLVLVVSFALAAGLAATLLTAYLGVR